MDKKERGQEETDPFRSVCRSRRSVFPALDIPGPRPHTSCLRNHSSSRPAEASLSRSWEPPSLGLVGLPEAALFVLASPSWTSRLASGHSSTVSPLLSSPNPGSNWSPPCCPPADEFQACLAQKRAAPAVPVIWEPNAPNARLQPCVRKHPRL